VKLDDVKAREEKLAKRKSAFDEGLSLFCFLVFNSLVFLVEKSEKQVVISLCSVYLECILKLGFFFFVSFFFFSLGAE